MVRQLLPRGLTFPIEQNCSGRVFFAHFPKGLTIAKKGKRTGRLRDSCLVLRQLFGNIQRLHIFRLGGYSEFVIYQIGKCFDLIVI